MRKGCIFLIVFCIVSYVAFCFGPDDFDKLSVGELEEALKKETGKNRVTILNNLAKSYLFTESAKSVESAGQALELAKRLEYGKGEANAYYNLGHGLVRMGKYDAALENFRGALEVCKKNGIREMVVGIYDSFGIVYIRKGDYHKALDYLGKSLKTADSLDLKKEKAGPLSNMGVVYWHLGKPDKGLEYLFQALEIHKEMGNKRRIYVTLGNIGLVYQEIPNLDKSLEYYLEGLNVAEEYGDKYGIATFLHNIGNVYYDLKLPDKSLEFLEKALAMREKLGHKYGIASTCNNMGMIFRQRGEPDKALKYYLQALKMREEIGDKNGIAMTVENLANLYNQMGKYQKALDYYQRALKIGEEIDSKKGIIGPTYNMGFLFFQMKRYGQALRQFRKALSLAKDANFQEYVRASYEGLTDVYAVRGDFKKALENHREFHATDRKMLNEKMSRQLQEARAKYETEKKTREIDVLTRDNEIQKLLLGKTQIMRNAFIVAFILTVIIFILLFKKYAYFFSFWKKQKYIGQFRLLDKIGSGAMGTIYKAHKVLDKSDILAVKVLRDELFSDENSRKRFNREAALIDQLNHPNIVKIVERGESRHTLFLAMEYLNGQTLEQVMVKNTSMPLAVRLHIMKQIAEALSFIHSQSIIHRDMKPPNIMIIERDGDPWFVKLLDFGLAKMEFQSRLTQSGNFVGTMEYVPPEQILTAETSPANDIFSMGVTFYRMLAGEMPFRGETVIDIMRQIINKIPTEISELNPEVPENLNSLVMKMIDKDPHERPTAGEVSIAVSNLK